MPGHTRFDIASRSDVVAAVSAFQDVNEVAVAPLEDD